MSFAVLVRPAALRLFGHRMVVAVLSTALFVAPLPALPRSAMAQEASPPATSDGADPGPSSGSGAAPEPLAPATQEPAPAARGAQSEQQGAGTEKPAEAQSDAPAAAAASDSDSDSSTPAQTAAPMRHVAQKPEDLAFGTFSQSVVIDVPAFRGLEPKLSLQYSSSGGLMADRFRAGFVGVGWEIQGLSDIVRTAPVNGTPRFDGTDVYQLDGKDLMPCASGMTSPSCTTNGNFTGKIETYERIRLHSDNIWTVWSKDGTRSNFYPVSKWGSTVEASDDDEELIKDKYRWLLGERIDTSENKATYSYACRTLPVCYPSTITYNGTEIRFVAADQPAYLTRATGRGIAKLDRQLKRIEIRTGGAKVRLYNLTQETSPSTGLLRLKQVRQYGQDWAVDANGTATGSALPARTFKYSDSEIEFVAGANRIHNDAWSERAGFDIAGDFNGDGRQDTLITKLISNNNCTLNIKLSTNNGFVQPNIILPYADGSHPCIGRLDSMGANNGFKVQDFNADGLSDIFIYVNHNYRIYITQYDVNNNTVSFLHKSIPFSTLGITNRYAENNVDLDGDGTIEIKPYDAQVFLSSMTQISSPKTTAICQ